MEKFRLDCERESRGGFEDKSLAGLILRSGVYFNVGGPYRVEALLNDGAGEFGFVAIATQMAEENVLEVGGAPADRR